MTFAFVRGIVRVGLFLCETINRFIRNSNKNVRFTYNEWGYKMSNLANEILRLKEEKNAVIMAHYYVNDDIQAIADYVGDSYYLSKVAVDLNVDVIVLCGVYFMGESAKILNPKKTVLVPEPNADCPMAHMIDFDYLKDIHNRYEDVAVVCYINSTAEIKQYADVCVTSANALDIVSKLPNKNIYFIPDRNLGSYIAKLLPEKNFIYNEGFCPIHNELSVKDIEKAKKDHPNAKVLIHPECQTEVLKMCDYIGSTSGIIKYASEHEDKEYIIATEAGVLYELKQTNPDKTFYPVIHEMICADMKKITLEKVYNTLNTMANEVIMTEEVIEKANQPLIRMLELAE